MTNRHRNDIVIAIRYHAAAALNFIAIFAFKKIKTLQSCLSHSFYLQRVQMRNTVRDITKRCPISWMGIIFHKYEVHYCILKTCMSIACLYCPAPGCLQSSSVYIIPRGSAGSCDCISWGCSGGGSCRGTMGSTICTGLEGGGWQATGLGASTISPL